MHELMEHGAGAPQDEGTTDGTGSVRRNEPTTCIILEDEALVAELIQNDLEEVGYRCIGSFARAADAMDWLTTGTPHIAILDFRLADGDCLRPAALLRERGVPILIYSALRPRGAVPEAIKGAPWLLKPAGPMGLKAAVWKLAGLIERKP